MAAASPMLDWMPWWGQVLAVPIAGLVILAVLLMPFAVFGTKARLRALQVEIEDLGAEIRLLAARVVEPDPPVLRSARPVDREEPRAAERIWEPSPPRRSDAGSGWSDPIPPGRETPRAARGERAESAAPGRDHRVVHGTPGPVLPHQDERRLRHQDGWPDSEPEPSPFARGALPRERQGPLRDDEGEYRRDPAPRGDGDPDRLRYARRPDGAGGTRDRDGREEPTLRWPRR